MLTQANPLLSSDEECSLARRAQKGDKAAMQRLIRSNVGLVYSYVTQFTKFSPAGQSVHEDLCQEGCLGLFKAVQLFDPSKGCRFSTYATHWVKAYVSRYAQARIKPISTLHDYAVLDIDGPVSTGSHRKPQLLRDVLADEHAITPETQVELKGMSWVAAESLQRYFSDAAIEVLTGRLIEGRTLTEVGVDLGCSRERVRQLEMQLVPKFREVVQRELAREPRLEGSMGGLATKNWKKCPRGCGHSIRPNSKHTVCYFCRKEDERKDRAALAESQKASRAKGFLSAWEKQHEELRKDLPASKKRVAAIVAPTKPVPDDMDVQAGATPGLTLSETLHRYGEALDPKDFSDDLLVKCIAEAKRRHAALREALGALALPPSSLVA
ncbi:MAG: sigma-70 family RNA polymerase sigma factor [Sphingomonas sp.]|jgi:RNA polymerase sigma factor (sigma-70 family)|uniref:sigma-70 family RNA polymerase sigma factor n=1 Tax=Sphingomonas sp. TaxID=28214 RepID=UPI00356B331C